MPTKFDLSKFTDKARNAMARAQEIARDLRHKHVEVEHALLSLLEQDDGIADTVLQKLDIDVKKLGRDLISELELMPKSYERGDQVYVGKQLLAVLEDASDVADDFGDKFTSTEHLLIAFSENRKSFAGRLMRQRGATGEAIRETLEDGDVKEKTSSPDEEVSGILGKFAEDLTQLARDGELDPVIGRSAEIRRVMQILTRRSKNNPVLLGEPGVGKTAIVEALAQRLVAGDVPTGLQGKRIMSLDVGSLVAGTSLRGQFEERVKAVIQEVIDSKGEILLFIDEIHQIVGAGGEGSGNAANLLKPALARGELSVVGTTTLDEFREYIEEDAALERRFQSILVEEVSVDGCISILRGIKPQYEIHHSVQINDSALVAAAEMTDRYVTDRALPDKAIDAIDEAASRLRLEIDSKPVELDRVERRIESLRMEEQSLVDAKSSDSVEARESLANEIESMEEEASRLRVRWEMEKEALDALTARKEELDATEKNIAEAERDGDLGRAAELRYSAIPRIQKEIEKAEERLDEIHEEERLLKDYIDDTDIAKVIGDWTGIPTTKMLESERAKLLNMPDRLRRRVVGQDHAIQAICKAIWRSRAGLQDPGRPIGNFMFVGPTGVGKTELAKALSQFLFDSEDALVRIDMSEYMEQSKVNTLIGSARGYVGSEEGGVLTEAVRLKPYSVVLFDEAEKAHPDVFNILLQVMDEGRLTDSQGRRVDFTNTLIILTSNVGSRRIMDLTGKVDEEEMTEEVQSILKDHFKPEFLNRLDAPIVFQALTREAIRLIVDIQERRLQKLLADQNMTIALTEEAEAFLAEQGYEPEYGARPLKRAIGTWVQDPLAEEILGGKFHEGDHIVVEPSEDGEKLVFRKGEPGEAVEEDDHASAKVAG
ncbi:MAG: ATP-dependent Clp protease ATP-binding subunit [Myxococcota bacterium]